MPKKIYHQVQRREWIRQFNVSEEFDPAIETLPKT